ncbi:uncharacterized protein LOC126982318 [Eriocheir sinensis]|uniref:uncharacterized protein LOC126982318 n=1 Tax=Eriocheir sinensis TaxID=95602 RepID=UPI0021C9B220|nr:uncharacterized protein LOC126982318 [Eriocheir sinensis]
MSMLGGGGGGGWRGSGGGAAHSFSGVVKALHGLAQRGGVAARGAEGQELYPRLTALLEREPGLARLLGRRDVEVLAALLQAEPRAWPWLGPAVAAALRADTGDGERRAWINETHAVLLARGAAASLLQGASRTLPADLFLLEACVARPGVDDVVVVVNAVRLLIKQQEEAGWAGDAAPLLAALRLLHTWRRPLATALPGWPASLRRWCVRLAKQPAALPLLGGTLMLVRDLLQEAPPPDALPWLETLLGAAAEVQGSWRWAAAPTMLLTLASATAGLATTLQALLEVPHLSLQQEQLQAALKQLLALLDERGDPAACQLPADALGAVLACACRLLDLSPPPLLFWVAAAAATPTRVLQAVEDSPAGGGGAVVVEEARLVTALLRVLSHFSVRVLALALRRLGALGAGGEDPLLGVVAEWFSAVVASGLRLDPAACLLPPAGTPLLQALAQHFRRRHDSALLQVAAFALLGGDTASIEARAFGEAVAREVAAVQDTAVRGACTLVAFTCCPRPIFLQSLAARAPGQAAADVAACQRAAAAAHPKYQELLAALARQAAPLLHAGALHE